VTESRPLCIAEPGESEPSASTQDPLHSDVCGPLLYSGEGVDQRRELAHHIAEKEARQRPTYCAVDCEAAYVKEAYCGPRAVSGPNGYVAVTWTCSVIRRDIAVHLERRS